MTEGTGNVTPNPAPTTPAPSDGTVSGNVPAADNPPTTGNPADAQGTTHAPSDSSSVSDNPEQTRDQAFEERRQEELAEAREVHAERGSEPDASQQLTADHPNTGAGETKESE